MRRAFKQEMSIIKFDLVSMLINILDEIIYQMDLSEEEGADAENGDTYNVQRDGESFSSTAHFILRRLRDTGWIESEYRVDSFAENITLPDYSVKLINLLYSLIEDSFREYNSYVYSTYSALNTADQERDNYMYDALLTTYGNTVKLLDDLKTLHNNIRRYHQALNEYATVNEILRSHFDC
ncbi:MAG: Wadjet anti-phage system protein JetA family protein [bacterium]